MEIGTNIGFQLTELDILSAHCRGKKTHIGPPPVVFFKDITIRNGFFSSFRNHNGLTLTDIGLSVREEERVNGNRKRPLNKVGTSAYARNSVNENSQITSNFHTSNNTTEGIKDQSTIKSKKSSFIVNDSIQQSKISNYFKPANNSKTISEGSLCEGTVNVSQSLKVPADCDPYFENEVLHEIDLNEHIDYDELQIDEVDNSESDDTVDELISNVSGR
ncbi:hypothetical protein Bhyg_07903 [Pseudolycoriella hygida]|uniref:Uncharacterized protein n=1 Tax=Pseudolycoriella hygida TaxID=35572 RepID=A0A9Q0N4D3_9DIPT|nr:hypothetical protein Bhyg_07903 [Pseudolycoriella hygida]